MELDIQHVKDCVCVHHRKKYACTRHEIMQGAKCETHNHHLFQTWKHDYPKILYSTESKNYTQKHLERHFINKMECTPQHKT